MLAGAAKPWQTSPGRNKFMLRDKNLIPLSRQHQHALALCVRIDRAIQAGEIDLPAWQAEIHQGFQQEIQFHFLAEEKELFPVAQRFPELCGLVEELIQEHAILREFFSRAGSGILDVKGLREFGQTLSNHIRKEERQLFEGLQQRMSADELASMGAALGRLLQDAVESCVLPNDATRIRPRS